MDSSHLGGTLLGTIAILNTARRFAEEDGRVKRIEDWWRMPQPEKDKYIDRVWAMLKEKSQSEFKDAKGAKLRYAPCCNQAVKVFCVCDQCTECPAHGRVCHGSHD